MHTTMSCPSAAPRRWSTTSCTRASSLRDSPAAGMAMTSQLLRMRTRLAAQEIVELSSESRGSLLRVRLHGPRKLPRPQSSTSDREALRLPRSMAEARPLTIHPICGGPGKRHEASSVGVHPPDIVGEVGVRRVRSIELAGGTEDNLGTIGRPLRQEATRIGCGGIGERREARTISVHPPDIVGAVRVVAVLRIGPIKLLGGIENNSQPTGASAAGNQYEGEEP